MNDKRKKTVRLRCREYTSCLSPLPKIKIKCQPQVWEGGKDDNTGLLYSLMADERDNQTNQTD